ncbi:hypothetical protein MJG53_017775 [Ovis ammon polii x Ovis aries]|uniref:Uncharacterized protein n=1 Tax=Ovis ammon polii x Ovis aries TaxID=2918886 RepID=A0ACB9U592_9CETA|nr:hypothetical protein MJG53_017775 [Ovis ammon polii x Ovis aries]
MKELLAALSDHMTELEEDLDTASPESGAMLTSALIGDTNGAQLRAVGPRPSCCGLSEAPLKTLRAVQTVFQADRRPHLGSAPDLRFPVADQPADSSGSGAVLQHPQKGWLAALCDEPSKARTPLPPSCPCNQF